MATDETPWFSDWELDTSTCNTVKQEKQLSASQRRYYSFCRRKVSEVNEQGTFSCMKSLNLCYDTHSLWFILRAKLVVPKPGVQNITFHLTCF